MKTTPRELKAVARSIKVACVASIGAKGYIRPLDFTWEKVARRAITAFKRAHAKEPCQGCGACRRRS